MRMFYSLMHDVNILRSSRYGAEARAQSNAAQCASISCEGKTRLSYDEIEHPSIERASEQPVVKASRSKNHEAEISMGRDQRAAENDT